MKRELNLDHLHTDKDGIKYYKISKGTPLYRTLEHQNGTLESKPTFFALNSETVKENYKAHGYPHKFILKQDVKLIALHIENPKFYEKATDIQEELNKYYGMNTNKRIRDSNNKGDTKVLNYICKHFSDYQGYFADQMKTPDSFMHAEIGLCNNGKSNLVNDGIMISLTKSEIENIKLAMISKNEKQSRNNKVKKTRRLSEIKSPVMPPKMASLSPMSSMSPMKPLSPMSPMALNFGDDNEDSINMSPKKLKFGGRKKRTSKRTSKHNSTRRSRKQTTRKHQK